MNTIDSPLVSIVVITYNSSKYILETLESAKNQTHSNIELVVSDDCSTDNTIEIVEQWIVENNNYFKNIKFVKSNINTGISGNCNRGIIHSNGEYLKMIAGDDLLRSNCIEDFIGYFLSNNQIQIAASQTSIFFNNDINNFQIWPQKGQFPAGLEKQQKEILKANFIYNVSLFFTRELFNNVGGFDENYPMIEDYPFDYKVLQAGYEFFLLEKICVDYRVNFDSTTRPANQNKFVNEISHKNGSDFMKKEILARLKERRMYLWLFLRWSKIEIITRVIRNGNNINSFNNILLKKLLFLNKYFSSKLRVFENRYS
jgi:glycosyltransferase involved in cell wall biosynthesis